MMADNTLCQSISDLVNNDLVLTATEDNYFDEDLIPGTYVFTITGTDPASNTQTATFNWVLTSPCDPPTSLDDTMQTNYSDTYTGTPQTFVLTDFTVVPSRCQSELVYTCTGVVD